MVDTQFEQILRAHSFWQEWQNAADQSTEPETITEHLASVSEDWAVVLTVSPSANRYRNLIIDLAILKKDLESVVKTSLRWQHYINSKKPKV